MRLLPFLAASAALLVSPAHAAQKLGERTATPERILEQMGLGVSDAELERAVAAAAAHPLGSLENPVRVGGPQGQRAYMARLRCSNGERPAIGPRKPAGIGAFGTIVDLYPLDCGAAAPGGFGLVMDMYHDGHRESRAPAGFTIVAP